MYSLSWSVAALVAPLLGGVVIDQYGADALWAGCAAVGTLAAVGYGLLLRNLPEESGTVAAAGQPAVAPAETAGEPVS